MLKEVGIFLKDCLFPYFCTACGREGEWWCKACRGQSMMFSFPSEEVEEVTALFRYRENEIVGRLIKDFKFGYATDLENLWRDIIFDSGYIENREFVVIPVPLFPRRLRERGFNQAEILGEIFADYLNLRCSDGLLRRRATDQQARLSKEERKKNVADAFVWAADSMAPEMVLLVDDVYTTGSTMRECALALKRAGAKTVRGLVLAHG